MQFSSLEFGCVFFSFSKIFRFQQALAVTFIQKCKIVLLKIVFENLYLFWTPCVMSTYRASFIQNTKYCLDRQKKAR
jgi:hypothetical protein